MKTITIVRIEKNGRGIFRPLEEDKICIYINTDPEDNTKFPLVQSVYDRHRDEFRTPYDDNLNTQLNNKNGFVLISQ